MFAAARGRVRQSEDVNPLLLPIELPIRVAARVVDDARSIAVRLDSRLDTIQRQIADVIRLARDGVGTVQMLDRHMQSMAANMRQVHDTLVSIDHQTERLNQELPRVQRGFALLEPLEGTMERVGRVVDRLPRWISGDPQRPPRTPPAPPVDRMPPSAAPR
jgi:septal ring factor EnvC (AmiA/AmiB activator)